MSNLIDNIVRARRRVAELLVRANRLDSPEAQIAKEILEEIAEVVLPRLRDNAVVDPRQAAVQFNGILEEIELIEELLSGQSDG